jgi:hypothetical protein
MTPAPPFAILRFPHQTGSEGHGYSAGGRELRLVFRCRVSVMREGIANWTGAVTRSGADGKAVGR